MNNCESIKVEKEDKKEMMHECVELFLEEHPEMRGMKISQKFMFKKLVKFYLKN